MNYKHGMSGTRLYRAWQAMIQRCLNPKEARYASYGGRGIRICKAWRGAAVFCKWAQENGYQDDLSLDRIDPDGHYEPANCRWATREIQARNQRLARTNNTSGYRGASFHKRVRRWQAQIGVLGVHIHLGHFDTARQAARAYDAYVTAHNLEHTLNFQEVT